MQVRVYFHRDHGQLVGFLPDVLSEGVAKFGDGIRAADAPRHEGKNRLVIGRIDENQMIVFLPRIARNPVIIHWPLS